MTERSRLFACPALARQWNRYDPKPINGPALPLMDRAKVALNPDIRASIRSYRFLPLVHRAFGKGEGLGLGQSRHS